MTMYASPLKSAKSVLGFIGTNVVAICEVFEALGSITIILGLFLFLARCSFKIG